MTQINQISLNRYNPERANPEIIKKSENTKEQLPEVKKAQGFRISIAVKRALLALTIVTAVVVAAALAATIILSSGIALTALIVSSVALGILCTEQIYTKIRKHLPSPIRHVADFIRAQVVEIFAAIALGFFKIQDLEKKNPKSEKPNNQQPILLVHGYLGSSSDWTYLHYRLKNAGLSSIFSINLGSVNQTIDGDYAQKVKQKVEEIAQITGRNDITLIGHSMGGIVSSFYAENLAPKGTVTDVITLGSPLHGTQVAKIGLGKCAKQMECSSKLLQELHEKIYDSEYTRYYNFASNADEIIIPNKSALLDQNKMKSKIKTHTFKDLGHAAYLLSDRVADKLINYIENNQIAASAA